MTYDQLRQLAKDCTPCPGTEMLVMLKCINCADAAFALTGADRRDAEDEYHAARAELDKL